jgi:Fe-S cluster biogenesis protein NfuA
MADPRRLDDAAVEQRLARIDELLGKVEQVPGPTREAALEAVATLTEVYGEALARVVTAAPEPLARRFSEDELLGHLLALHEIHPEPLPERVRRALGDVRPHLESHGARVELVDLDATTARVRISGGCGCSAGSLEDAVREAVLALAPELTGVETVPVQEQEPSVIPVEAVMSRTKTRS